MILLTCIAKYQARTDGWDAQHPPPFTDREVHIIGSTFFLDTGK